MGISLNVVCNCVLWYNFIALMIHCGLEFELVNAIVFGERALSSLWYLSTHMRISINII